MYMTILPACMYVNHVYAWYPWKSGMAWGALNLSYTV